MFNKSVVSGKEGWLKAGVVGKIRLSLIDYE